MCYEKKKLQSIMRLRLFDLYMLRPALRLPAKPE